MSEGILLADFIESVRNELAGATRRRSESKRMGDQLGTSDPVGDLAVNEIVVEASVTVHQETTGEAGVKIWVLAASGTSRSSTAMSHKVIIRMTVPQTLVLGGATGCGSHPDHAATRTDFRSGRSVSAMASPHRSLVARARSWMM